MLLVYLRTNVAIIIYEHWMRRIYITIIRCAFSRSQKYISRIIHYKYDVLYDTHLLHLFHPRFVSFFFFFFNASSSKRNNRSTNENTSCITYVSRRIRRVFARLINERNYRITATLYYYYEKLYYSDAGCTR